MINSCQTSGPIVETEQMKCPMQGIIWCQMSCSSSADSEFTSYNMLWFLFSNCFTSWTWTYGCHIWTFKTGNSWRHPAPCPTHTLALCILEAASIINFACIALHKYIYTQYTPVSIYCITLGYRLTYNMHGIEILKIIKN